MYDRPGVGGVSYNHYKENHGVLPNDKQSLMQKELPKRPFSAAFLGNT